MTDMVSIQISRDLYTKIEKRVRESSGEFRNVQDYVTYVLSEVAKEQYEPKQVYTTEEEREISNRLRNLGYL